MRRTRVPGVVALVVALVVAAVRADTPPAPVPPDALPPAPVPFEPVKPPAPVPEPAQSDEVPPPHPDGPEEEPPVPHGRFIPEMFGDQAPVNALLTLRLGLADRPPLVPGGAPRPGLILVPSARSFKIADDDSPQPQNRSYFSFNYFYNLDGAVNQFAGAGIQHTRIHREIWGWEWADAAGDASFGLRLPLNTYNAANTVPGLDGTSTDIGDLSCIFKYVVWRDEAEGHLVSAGLAVTPPTGPGSFAGSNNIKGFHNTSLQPFCGSVWNLGPAYVQHFTAVDAPTDLNDVVLLSNDVGAGYFLHQKPGGGSITAVVPAVELHVTTPLNHRGILALTDKAGTPDMVDLTGGVNFEYCDQSTLAVGFAVPLTGPRMFDFEILAQFRSRY
jgi:hypothetical protein